MVGITELSSLLSSLKAARDISEAMFSLRDATAMQTKRFELQSKILDAQASALAAQEERSSLMERIRQLEEETARLKAWDGEKERYRLKKFGDGAFAYVLQEESANGEPVHALCATCYERRQKSILQSNGKLVIHEHLWLCPICKTSVHAHSRVLNPAKS